MANTFKNYVTANVGVTALTVLTGASATQTTIIGFSIANTTANAVTCDVRITRFSGGVTVYIVKGASIGAGSALVLSGGDQKIVVMASDIVDVKSSAATSLDVCVSVLEIA
jgi:hypothetical protein